jgi:hypothetical protein
MWGTSSPEDKLTGNLGNVIEATSIGGRRSDFFYSKKIGAGQFGTFATISARSERATSRRLWPLLDEDRTSTCLKRFRECRYSELAVFRIGDGPKKAH